jgi:hypothetical protein
MRFIQFIIIFRSSNEFLEFKFEKRNFGKEKLMSSFGPHLAQVLATVAQTTTDSGLRGPCPRHAPGRPNRGHYARGVGPWRDRRRWPSRLGVAGAAARASGVDREPVGHGGRQRGSPWRSGVGGAEEKLRGSGVLPGDSAPAGYGQPWGSL